MKRKIIGVTVGSPLPKPNLNQTDPRKGDFVKGKEIIPSKVSDLENDAGYLTEDDMDEIVERVKAPVAADAEAAAKSATNAEKSATGAKASEEAAGAFAERAEAATQNAAWVEAEINEDGHLILSQSENFLGAEFSINENGHLEVAYK